MNGPSRRTLLAGAIGAAGASLAGRAIAAPQALPEQEALILRRPLRPGEDERWHALTQTGPHNPEPVPVQIPFGQSSVFVHWPRQARSGRLVVFSHAALTDPLVYRPLLQHWASHGFVVVAPVHDDSVFQRGLLTRRASAAGSSVWEVDRILNDSLAWDARCESCRGLLEHYDLLAKAVGIDIITDRPIIVGHEFGAYVAQLLLGASVVQSSAASVPRFDDDRWAGACMLSPQGVGIMGLTETSWSGITRPMMVVQAAKETDFTGQPPERKIDAFKLSAPNNKHLAWFKDGTASLYKGPRAGMAPDSVLYEDLKAVTTAYLLSYANYDEATFRALTGDWPERSTLDRVKTWYR